MVKAKLLFTLCGAQLLFFLSRIILLYIKIKMPLHIFLFLSTHPRKTNFLISIHSNNTHFLQYLSLYIFHYFFYYLKDKLFKILFSAILARVATKQSSRSVISLTVFSTAPKIQQPTKSPRVRKCTFEFETWGFNDGSPIP